MQKKELVVNSESPDGPEHAEDALEVSQEPFPDDFESLERLHMFIEMFFASQHVVIIEHGVVGDDL